jgi:hypothetical protein
MTSINGNGDSESLTTTARDAAARCLARAAVSGFDVCEESGMPLAQLQKVAILEAALVEFDGMREHLFSLDALHRILSELEAYAPSRGA